MAILEVARDLFARYGYKKTTMEDIAISLRKGKSSLYYYFKNKEEIFQAVIDMETELLYSKLREVVYSERDPVSKLRDYVITRMETMAGLDNYQKVVKEELYGGYDFLKSVKKDGDTLEEEFLKTILDEGVNNDVFQVKNTRMGAIGIATALRGLEIPLFRGISSKDEFSQQLGNILNILFYGVIKRA